MQIATRGGLSQRKARCGINHRENYRERLASAANTAGDTPAHCALTPPRGDYRERVASAGDTLASYAFAANYHPCSYVLRGQLPPRCYAFAVNYANEAGSQFCETIFAIFAIITISAARSETKCAIQEPRFLNSAFLFLIALTCVLFSRISESSFANQRVGFAKGALVAVGAAEVWPPGPTQQRLRLATTAARQLSWLHLLGAVL